MMEHRGAAEALQRRCRGAAGRTPSQGNTLPSEALREDFSLFSNLAVISLNINKVGVFKRIVEPGLAVVKGSGC